jgi:hypothetical protein
MRNERDFRHWKLVDAAVDGSVCIFIGKTRSEVAVEHGRVMGMLGEEKIEPTRVRRGPHMDVCFEGGGMIMFVSDVEVRRLRGFRLDLAMTTASLSHWDRRDIERLGAIWV